MEKQVQEIADMAVRLADSVAELRRVLGQAQDAGVEPTWLLMRVARENLGEAATLADEVAKAAKDELRRQKK
jgi:hypothetical protein